MGRKSKAIVRDQAKKRKRLLDVEIAQLEERIKETAPEKGSNPLLDDYDDDGKEDPNKDPPKRKFLDHPLSEPTIKGLTGAKFTKMTAIQRAVIPHILCGRDVLAAAKTGSGKTLAFLVPMLEKLYRLRWCQTDGLGALIITPIRELALQIFDVLRSIGKYHTLSAGLIIGGKDQKAEEERIGSMNILVCTPGRLLHHLDVSAALDPVNLQMLILDEADRILDMGFERTMNAIIASLPKKRQTLLFSATQTKSVKSLARLSLSEPEYLSVHENDKFSTPNKLQQSVLFCPLEEKVNTVWSFLRTHTNEKSIIFLSSCKQVRYYLESFKLLRPGCPIVALHGKIKQMKRLSIYKSFCEREGGCALFATDLAARGLDFKNVDWVIQADCPEDTDTYIHRVGRTARYRKSGKSLLVLLPSEAKMMELLESRRVPLKQIKVNPKRNQDIRNLLLSLNSQNPELKYLAQKAFVSYVRSVYLNGNKDVFSASELPLKEYAESMGLIGTPRIRFIQKLRHDKNIPANVIKAKEQLQSHKKEKEEDSDVSDYESDPEIDEVAVVKTKATKQRERVNQGTFSEHYKKLIADDESESEDELLVSKRIDHDIDDEEVAPVQLSNRKKKRLLRENISGLNSRVQFDDEGNPLTAVEAAIKDLPEQDEVTRDEYITNIREELKLTDRDDYLHAKRIRQEKKQKRKEREREEVMREQGYPIVTIGPSIGGGMDSGEEYYSMSEDDMESGEDVYSGDESSSNDSSIDNDSSDDEIKPGMKRNRPNDLKNDKNPKKQKLDVEDMEAEALRILERSGI